MRKISSEQSREIYQLATSPNNKLSNREIGLRYGVSERVVRHHIKKMEKELHMIAENDAKVAAQLAKLEINTRADLQEAIKNTKYEIQQSRNRNISPEKTAPLLSVWIKALELSHKIQMDSKLEELEKRIAELEKAREK